MEHTAITSATASLFEVSSLTSALVLAVIGLCAFIKILLADAREERNLYRTTLEANTRALTSLQEVIRAAIK